MVEVRLIAKTTPILSRVIPLEEFLGRIGKWSRSPEIPLEDVKKPADGWDSFLVRVKNLGHTSILEHVSLTFLIWNVSRVLTHQLVRHRIASYTQKSLRSLAVHEVILPDSTMEVFKKITALNGPLWWYQELLRQGVSKEDARYLAPQGAETSIIMTMNLRELLGVFIPLRIAPEAQEEIRILARKILTLCKGECPHLFEGLEG